MNSKSRLYMSRVLVLVVAMFVMFTSISTGYTESMAREPSVTGSSVNSVPVERSNQAQSIMNPNPPPEIIEDHRDRTYPELMLTLMVIALALAALSMQFFLLKRNVAIQAEDSLRSFGVILIIIGTLFFITAGFDSEQIAPALGLFGTIAGYLLGKTRQVVPATNQTQKGNKSRG